MNLVGLFTIELDEVLNQNDLTRDHINWIGTKDGRLY